MNCPAYMVSSFLGILNFTFYKTEQENGSEKKIFLNSTFISHAYPDLEITKTKCHPFLSCVGTL